MNNIITLSGDPGSGKSTVRNALKKEFEKQGKNVRIYCVGDIFRKLAEDRAMTVTEFNKMLESKNTNVDEQIDQAVAEFGEKIVQENEPNKIYLIDSRMAWKNIPSAYKVRLTVTDKIAGQRIFGDKTRGKEDKYSSVEDAIRETKARKKSERERYLELYDVDIALNENFDININTAFVSPEEIAETIIKNMHLEKNNLDKHRVWASPKLFLPTQSFGDTHCTFADVRNRIAKNGYSPKETILAYKRGGAYFLADGHHSSFAAASLGINLIPYSIGEDKDVPEEYTIKELRDYLRHILGRDYTSILYSYEGVWEDKKTRKLTYTYDEAYPGIYDLQQNTDSKITDYEER